MAKGYDLSKEKFWDCVCLRYGWRLTNIPSTCSCGSKMNIQHAMSCKKGGEFITIRHNDLCDLTANLLTEVCKDVDIEPQLLPVTGETLKLALLCLCGSKSISRNVCFVGDSIEAANEVEKV